MHPLAHPLILLGIASAALGLVGAAVVWGQREVRGARTYTLLLVILSTWSLLYVAELLSGSVPAKRPWLVARHAITPAVALSFWVFAARYTDSQWMLRRRLLGPIVAGGAALTLSTVVNPGGLYWRSLILVEGGPLVLLDQDFGPLFWAMILYIAVVVGYGHARIVSLSFDSFDVYRRQLLALGVSGVVEFALLGVFLTGHLAAIPTVNPNPHVQLITYSTVLVAIPLGWSYYRDALFDLQPLANQTVIGNMDDAVFVLDTEGVVRKTNTRAGELLGGPSPPSLVGQSATAVFADHPALGERYRGTVAHEDSEQPTAASDADHLDVPADNGVAETRPGDADPVAIEVNGEEAYVDLRTSAIRNARGDVVGRVLVVRDVTERARQRRRLERTNEQLERLADVVAHDMRGPVSTAQKLTTLLEQDLESPDDHVEQSLSDLERVHGRLEEFADHIPRLAREGTDVEAPVECDLGAVAEDAWGVVGDDEVRLIVEETITLAADPRRLQQALENLFRNALEHGRPDETPESPGATDGGIESSTGPGESASVAEGVTTIRVGTFERGVYVADDGPGVPPRLREDIFEYGVSTAEGSGFGLAIVRTIVEAHGWEIAITDAREGGARFEIRTSP